MLAIAMPANAAVICRKPSGAMFVRDACKKKETLVDLSAFGAVGPKGDPGDPGTPATALWAVVNADGTLARGSGVVSTAKLEIMAIVPDVGPLAMGDGSYEVIFERDVTACAYTATLGTAEFGDTPLRGQIEVARRFMHADGVFVATSDDAGTDHDGGFHLAVFCPQ
jgi:hypothetical protein